MTSIRHIMVPVDFSDGSDRAIEYAVTLASKLDAIVHLLHVWQPPPYVVPEMVVTVPGGAAQTFDEYMRERTEGELERFAAPHREGSDVEFVMDVATGTPKEVILRYLRAHPMDLVVMGTHGRTGVMHALLGSVAEYVVRNQPCPVLTVRYPEKD